MDMGAEIGAWTGDYCIADHLALYGTYCGT